MNREPTFNKRCLEKLVPMEKRYRVLDMNSRESIKGLTLEVLPSGKKSFRFRRKFKGRDIQVTIGDFPALTVEQARKCARVIVADFSEGKDPNQVKRDELKRIEEEKALSMTVQELYDAYIAEFHLKIKTGERRAASINDMERAWRIHVGPRIAKRQVSSITREEAKTLLKLVLAKSTVNIRNKCLTLLKAMYREQDVNPFWHIKKIEGKKRERILNKDEMQRLLISLEDEEPIYRDVVMMLLLTGQRKTCVFSIEWNEIDHEHAIWRIPTSKMKAKRPHAVPLTKEAMEILKRRSSEAEQGERYVFPSRWGSKSGHIVEKSGLGSFWRRITKRAGLYSEDKERNVTVHDIRRTVASWSVMRGGNLQVTSKLLGHSDISITASTYAHLDVENVRKELSVTATEMLNSSPIQDSNSMELRNFLGNLNQSERIKLVRILLS